MTVSRREALITLIGLIVLILFVIITIFLPSCIN